MGKHLKISEDIGNFITDYVHERIEPGIIDADNKSGNLLAGVTDINGVLSTGSYQESWKWDEKYGEIGRKAKEDYSSFGKLIEPISNNNEFLIKVTNDFIPVIPGIYKLSVRTQNHYNGNMYVPSSLYYFHNQSGNSLCLYDEQKNYIKHFIYKMCYNNKYYAIRNDYPTKTTYYTFKIEVPGFIRLTYPFSKIYSRICVQKIADL